MLLAAAFAAVAIGARADQIIAGTALTLGAVGLTGTIYRHAYGTGGAGLALPTLAPVPIPVLSRIPMLGPALFDQPAPTYLALVALPVVWWVLFRTRPGLALRATGEGAAMARAAGVRTGCVRAAATIVGGGFAGLAGATLVLAQVGTFAEKMTAGRGYVAIAHRGARPLAPARAWRWRRCCSARRRRCSTCSRRSGLAVPYQLFLMLPYVLTLLALAGAVGRVRAPADLGKA